MAKKCSCNLGWFVLGVVVLAFGLFALVRGLQAQWTSAEWLLPVAWYAGGALLVCVGKMLKWKGCGGCASHCPR